MSTPPTVTSVSYDGTTIRAAWTAAPPPGFLDYVVLLSTNGAPPEPFSTGATAWELARALDGGSAYTLQVVLRATGEPDAASPVYTLITGAPAWVQIDNNGATVAYRWTSVHGAAVEGYAAALVTPATTHTETTVAGTVRTTFTIALAGQGACTAWVRATGGGGVVSGPPTPIRPVITEAPAWVQIDNRHDEVVYRWLGAGGDGVERYVAALVTPAQTHLQATPINVHTTTFAYALAGLGACQAWVRATSLDNRVLGPPSPLRAVITEAPGWTLVDNDGATVTYQWTAAGGAGVERYLAALVTPAQTHLQATAAGVLTTAFAQALEEQGASQAWVRATSLDNRVLGPPSPELELITALSPLGAIAYDAGQLTLDWFPASDPATDYVAQVTPAGQPAQRYSIGATGTGTAAVELTAGTAYQVVVRGASPHVLGPPSNTRVPLTAPPTAAWLRALTTSGFRAVWAAPPGGGVTGYTAQLLANGAVAATVPNAVSPLPFAVIQAAGVRYQLRVRAVGVQVQGPWALVEGPFLTRQVPAFDALGRLQTSQWDGGPRVTYTLDAFGNITAVAWT